VVSVTDPYGCILGFVARDTVEKGTTLAGIGGYVSMYIYIYIYVRGGPRFIWPWHCDLQDLVCFPFCFIPLPILHFEGSTGLLLRGRHVSRLAPGSSGPGDEILDKIFYFSGMHPVALNYYKCSYMPAIATEMFFYFITILYHNMFRPLRAILMRNTTHSTIERELMLCGP
jgi:hypothetical protein